MLPGKITIEKNLSHGGKGEYKKEKWKSPYYHDQRENGAQQIKKTLER